MYYYNSECVIIETILSIIIAFSCSACSRASNKQAEVESSKGNVSSERIVDTLKISSLRTVDIFDCVDSIDVVLYNSYQDTIELQKTYCIYQEDTNELLMKGSHPAIKINPKSSCAFRISVGLDSIKYKKRKYYRFTFIGHSSEVDVVYSDIIMMGNRYKMKGVGILEPDTIYLPLSKIPDDELNRYYPKDDNANDEDNIAASNAPVVKEDTSSYGTR